MLKERVGAGKNKKNYFEIEFFMASNNLYLRHKIFLQC